MQVNCSGPECHRVVYVKTTGLCRQHNVQYRRGIPLTPLRGNPKACKHDGCQSLSQAKGFCRPHYMQFWKYGKTYGKGGPVECKATNCRRPVSAAGLCQRHFANGIDAPIHGTPGVCKVQTCEDNATGDLCRPHRTRCSTYHLSVSELVELLGDGTCEACGGNFKTLDIHHDHNCCDFAGSCGECVVAALCSPCNKAAGQVRDDAERLRRIADVLDRGPKFQGRTRIKDTPSPMTRTRK